MLSNPEVLRYRTLLGLAKATDSFYITLILQKEKLRCADFVNVEKTESRPPDAVTIIPQWASEVIPW
jgi:hypothetical protein